MSDAVWLAAILCFQTIVMAWMAQRAAKKLDVIAEVGDKTHKLTNSAMTLTLKANSVQARQIAELSKDKGDVIFAAAKIEAERAEKLYQEHVAKDTALLQGQKVE